MYGQELNPESYAICKADMLIKGQDIPNIIFGNTLSADGLPGKHFDYMLSNPPFGVEWKKIDFWIAGRIDRRTVGQIAAQFVLPGVSDAATGRCRGEPLLPSAECLPLTELRNLEPIPDRTPNRFLANGWRSE